MEKGIKNTLTIKVTTDKTAKSMGSGTLEVFATPALLALIEETAWRSISSELEEDSTTVGTKVEISHLSPTPLGMKIICETELIEVDGRKLIFKAQVHDEKDLICEGIHERFIVKADKFQAKANSKRINDNYLN